MFLRRKKKTKEEVLEDIIKWIENELSKVNYELTEEERESLRQVLMEDYGDAFEKKHLKPEKVLKDAPHVLTTTYFNPEYFVKHGWMVVKLAEIAKKLPMGSKMFPDDPKTYDPTENIAIAEKIPSSFYEKWQNTKAYNKFYAKLVSSAKRLEKLMKKVGFKV